MYISYIIYLYKYIKGMETEVRFEDSLLDDIVKDNLRDTGHLQMYKIQ